MLIEKFINLKKNFRTLDSIKLYFNLNENTTEIFLPKLKRTIYLRKSTKDLETFGEIFIKSIYDIELPIYPYNIVDAGANIGLATLYFKRKYSNSNIVTIEIENDNIEMVHKNIKDLQNVTVEHKALYNSKSYFKIIDPYNATNSFQIKEVSSNENFDIESITLDEILEKNNWETIDLLKIDIEGAEKELFEKNYENWIKKTKIIFIETHDRMKKNCSLTVVKTLCENNFILYNTTEGTLIFYNLNYIKI